MQQSDLMNHSSKGLKVLHTCTIYVFMLCLYIYIYIYIYISNYINIQIIYYISNYISNLDDMLYEVYKRQLLRPE